MCCLHQREGQSYLNFAVAAVHNRPGSVVGMAGDCCQFAGSETISKERTKRACAVVSFARLVCPCRHLKLATLFSTPQRQHHCTDWCLGKGLVLPAPRWTSDPSPPTASALTMPSAYTSTYVLPIEPFRAPLYVVCAWPPTLSIYHKPGRTPWGSLFWLRSCGGRYRTGKALGASRTSLASTSTGAREFAFGGLVSTLGTTRKKSTTMLC